MTDRIAILLVVVGVVLLAGIITTGCYFSEERWATHCGPLAKTAMEFRQCMGQRP